MIPDLTPFFTRYEKLRSEADAVFQHIAQQYPDCVCCKQGCSDCCNALFDLTLVEAMYINRAFNATFGYGARRSEILTKAAAIDRKLTKIKRELFHMEKEGIPQEQIFAKAAEQRMSCPLLEDSSCILYEARPITCRLYGIPTSIGQRGHVCGFSNFTVGTNYPSVHLDTIQSRLEGISRDIQNFIQSRFTELDQVYVPVSMALITKYDETYLGISQAKED